MKHLMTLIACLAGSAAMADPFVVNTGQPPSTMDPAFACDIVANGYVAPLYVTLVGYGRKDLSGPEGVKVTAEDDQTIVPGIATEWTTSEDGLTWTFTIAPGLTFASGAALDAAAVAASLNRALTSGGCGTYYMEAGAFGNTQSIVADGDKVTITLKALQPLLIHALTQPNLGIVDVAEADKQGGKDWLANNAAPSGPYVLAEYQPGVKAVYKANAAWKGEAPKEAEVVVNFIADPSALLLQARNGAADVTLGLPKQMVGDLASTMKVVEVPNPRFMVVGLPTKVAPFDNVKFRQALSYAVPYEAIRDSVAFGYAKTFFGPFPPEFSAYTDANGAPRAMDMDKAKALLAESGVTGDVPLELTIMEGSAEQEQIATILQGAWSALGVKATISKLSASAYVEATTKPEKTTAIVRFDGPSLADPAWLLSYDMMCASPYNQSNYCSEPAEKLLTEALAMPDLAARQAKWDEIAKIWIEDAPRIPVYADIFTAVLDKDVTAFDFAQDGPFDLQNWGR